jgi:lipopolysaccharide transport system permease protein
MAAGLWRRRHLVAQFTRRDVEGRYRGARFGLLWSLINPLLSLLIYTFVFGVVFKGRWPKAQTDNLTEFAVTLFCGILFYNVFAETVNRAPSLVVSQPNYVKKVVFPLEILPVSALGAALFHGAISLGILLVADLLIGPILPVTILLLPLLLVPLCALALGAAWALASLGVFFRDISQVVGLVMMLLFFVSPIFYSLEAVPESLRAYALLNPFSFLIEGFRQVVMWGEVPAWRPWLAWTAIGLGIMQVGYAFFMRTKRTFADVI